MKPITWRTVRGLVFVRMQSYVFADGSRRRGLVLPRMRVDERPPPSTKVEAWKPVGGLWREDWGGRWPERGDFKLLWEWTV